MSSGHRAGRRMGQLYNQYHYLDNDTDNETLAPPVLNAWNEVFDALDVALLYCSIYQQNDESAAKNIEVRWTIDGNVYLVSVAANHATNYYIFRNAVPSGVGTAGLQADTNMRMSAFDAPKHGQSFKVEFRITSAPGTNEAMICYCVKETEVAT